MSLRTNIEHLAAAQGIEAVAVTSTGSREFRGESSWNAVLNAAIGLLGKTDETTIRLVVGKHTIVVQTEKDETVAVLLPTGHAIAKSLRRMIRRMARKVRAPLRPQTAAPANPVVPASPTPSAPTNSGTQTQSSPSTTTPATSHPDNGPATPSWG